MEGYIIDSHAHLDDARFDEDREDIISNLEKDKLLFVINPASDLVSSKKAFDLSKKYEKIYAMIGTHPHEAKYYDDKTRACYKKMAKGKKVVAIGEIGLDYHYDLSDRQTQKEVFIDQIKLAKELNLPIVIHTRDAAEDTYLILEKYAKNMKVLIHAFSESWELCEKFLKLGFYIAIGGVITFKNAKKLLKVGQLVPIDRLLLETDSPYLTPHPYRGKRNEPKNIHLVVEKIAQLKEMKLDDLKFATVKNSMDFFDIDISKE